MHTMNSTVMCYLWNNTLNSIFCCCCCWFFMHYGDLLHQTIAIILSQFYQQHRRHTLHVTNRFFDFVVSLMLLPLLKLINIHIYYIRAVRCIINFQFIHRFKLLCVVIAIALVHFKMVWNHMHSAKCSYMTTATTTTKKTPFQIISCTSVQVSV